MTTLASCGCAETPTTPLSFVPAIAIGAVLVVATRHEGWPRRVALTAATGLACLLLLVVAMTIYAALPLHIPLLVNSTGAAFWLLTLLVAWLQIRSLVSGMPGARLAAIAEFCCHSDTYTLVYESVISDMQEEYLDALEAGRIWKARLERARGYWRFAQTAALQIPVTILKLIVMLWKLGS